MKKFVIIDTPAILHRAWHAIPLLKDKNGRVVNAVYGFTSILLKALGDLKPDYVALTFDRKEPTFRHKEFKEYKAQRVRQPQEFYDQFTLVKEMARAFGIPIFEVAGFEADDLIGTLTDLAEKNKDVESVVVTGDLDTLQLVDGQTKVLSLKKGVTDTVLYDEAAVRERYGLNPNQMIDYKALRGDPSDNIPGVRGIGEKGAAELIKEFGSIEKIYKYLESSPPARGGGRGGGRKTTTLPPRTPPYQGGDKRISERTAKLLREQKDDLALSKRLVTIVRDVPVKFNLEDCAYQKPNREKLVPLFEEFGFKSMVKRLPEEKKDDSQGSLFGAAGAPSPVLAAANTGDVSVVKSEKDLKSFLAAVKEEQQIAIRGLAKTGLAIAFGEEKYFIPKDFIKKEIKDILKNPEIKKAGHDLKNEIAFLGDLGAKLAGAEFDLMIANYLLNPGERGNNLETIVFSELGEAARAEISGETPEAAAAAASYIYKLKSRFEERLRETNAEKVFRDIELPLVSVLRKMEKTGILLDIGFLKTLSAQFERRLAAIQKKAFELAGESFNLNSPSQIKQILFEKLQVSSAGIRKTKTGLSTAASELLKLRGKHPLIDLIFEHRELAKLKSTYIDALPALADTKGRVHTSYNQTVTSTGRLSSSNPNIQNIPIRTDLGREIRKAFIAEPGYKIMSLDYSQVELRIVASMANDKNMISAFLKNEDIHTHTAAAIWNTAHEKVTPEMRRAAKAINFGIIYGMGPQGLSEGAGVSFNEARDFIRKYLEVYSGIKNYVEETKALAKSLGYVETIFGRRRYLPDIVSEIPPLRAAAERMAINMPVQGTAADLIKLAMIQIDRVLARFPDKIRMLLQVHDELVFEVRDDFIRDGSRLIRDLMENICKLKVPIKVDVEFGDNWGEMEKI